MSKIKVRFLIDKEQKRVVFAEVGSDFVDILFSFLTLPLGQIVRLLNKKSGFGSLDCLYESVEQLDDKHLWTEACKEMLLNPRSATAELCEDLKINNFDNICPWIFYICLEDSCLSQSTRYYTHTKQCRCSFCGKQMDKCWRWRKKTSQQGGVFVNETTKFMITNDLRVMPASLITSCSLLTELHIKDMSILEESIIDFGTREVLDLLQRSLVSKNALTEVYFPENCIMQANAHCFLPIKKEVIDNEEEGDIILKLLLNKKNNHVLYAEVGEDFINHLLSFLTLPLGSVLKFLPDNISLSGCIINLYKSVEIIGLNYFKSEICRNMLLTPKLYTFYGFKNQFLEIQEIASREFLLSKGCYKCYCDNGCTPCESSPCKHGIKEAKIIEQNPKSTRGVINVGEAFVAGSRRFMVADNLSISEPSFFSVMSNGVNLPLSDLVTVDVCMDKNKVGLFIGSMLISKTVLTDVFCPKQVQSKKS